MTRTDSLPVVVGVDGSGAALAAVVWAADEAVRRGTTLRIVHASLWPAFRPPAAHSPIQFQQPMLEHGRRLLFDALVVATERHPTLTVDSALVPTTPADLLFAESRSARLVVVGSRGHRHGLSFGALAATLAGHGRCPVVVVGGEGLATGPVVVGLDGSPHNNRALRFAFRAAEAGNAELVALHCADGPDDRLDDEHRLLAERLAGWSAEFPEVKVTPLAVAEPPVAALLRVAHGARLLVVGSRGRGGFTGRILGSTSRALLHDSPCPLAIVRNRGSGR